MFQHFYVVLMFADWIICFVIVSEKLESVKEVISFKFQFLSR